MKVTIATCVIKAALVRVLLECTIRENTQLTEIYYVITEYEDVEELGLWQCSDCGYTSPKTSNVRNHIEVNHIASQGYTAQNVTSSAGLRILSIFTSQDTSTRFYNLFT